MLMLGWADFWLWMGGDGTTGVFEVSGGGGLCRGDDKGLELGRRGALGMVVDVLGIADGCCAGRGGHVDLGAFVL